MKTGVPFIAAICALAFAAVALSAHLESRKLRAELSARDAAIAALESNLRGLEAKRWTEFRYFTEQLTASREAYQRLKDEKAAAAAKTSR